MGLSLEQTARAKPKWGLRLFRRRTVWCPTVWGALCIAVLLAIPVAWWMRSGEDVLASTRRLSADVLVVEGWIGYDGVDAAAAEFERRGYRYVIASGGPRDDRWDEERVSYAELAGRELIRSGVPEDKIIVAPAPGTERQRTYQSAVAVWRALHARGIQARALNVFTLGPHAGRSRLVFAKVYGPETQVGAIGWVPAEDRAMPWWRSSERAKGLLTETAGYLYEVLLNSGRFSKAKE